MSAEAGPEKPEWVAHLLSEIDKPHESPSRQIREWVGIIIGGLLAIGVLQGIGSLHSIQSDVIDVRNTGERTKESLATHIVSSNKANAAIANALTTLIDRTSRLEGLEEARRNDHRDD